MLFVWFQTVFIAYIKQIIYNLFVRTTSTSLAGDQRDDAELRQQLITFRSVLRRFTSVIIIQIELLAMLQCTLLGWLTA